MKVKYLAAACAALCAASTFAATYDPTITTPAQTVVISGASAQKNSLLNTVPTTIFDTTTRGVLYINGANGSVGWLGDAKAAYGGGVMLIVYQSKNGSAAGLNQLISAGTPEAEAVMLALPATGCGAKTVPSLPNIAAEQITCTGPSSAKETDMGLSDVFKNEFEPGFLVSGSTLKNAASAASTGLEGFGVIANSVLYDALLAQNIADGLLPASCATATASTVTAALAPTGVCQPSVRSADYASLVTSAGQFNSYAALVKDQANLEITVCRRDHLSGTQAASNIHFLNDVCGTTGFAGALAPSISTDSVPGTYVVVDETNTGTGQAENCAWSGSATGVAAYTGYAAGVVSLGEKDIRDSTSPQSAFPNAKYWFVKLDGVSPNYKADGTYDTQHRANLLTGAYHFGTEMGAYVKTATSLTTGNGKVVAAIANDIRLSTLSDVRGIAYLNNPAGYPADGKNARYSNGGNNCSVYQ